jgi:hypothetical protein
MKISFKEAVRSARATDVPSGTEFPADGLKTISSEEEAALANSLLNQDGRDRDAAVKQARYLLGDPKNFPTSMPSGALREAVISVATAKKKKVESVTANAQNQTVSIQLEGGTTITRKTSFRKEHGFYPDAFVTHDKTAVVYKDSKGVHIYNPTTNLEKFVPARKDFVVSTVVEGLTRTGSSRLFVTRVAEDNDGPSNVVVVETATGKALKRFDGMQGIVEDEITLLEGSTFEMSSDQDAGGAEGGKVLSVDIDTLKVTP